jgi:hypothetical protein
MTYDGATLIDWILAINDMARKQIVPLVAARLKSLHQ